MAIDGSGCEGRCSGQHFGLLGAIIFVLRIANCSSLIAGERSMRGVGQVDALEHVRHAIVQILCTSSTPLTHSEINSHLPTNVPPCSVRPPLPTLAGHLSWPLLSYPRFFIHTPPSPAPAQLLSHILHLMYFLQCVFTSRFFLFPRFLVILICKNTVIILALNLRFSYLSSP